jgi:hypothetical protein
VFLQLPAECLRQNRLRQPFGPPARRRNLAINGIRTLEQQADTLDDLVLIKTGEKYLNKFNHSKLISN